MPFTFCPSHCPSLQRGTLENIGLETCGFPLLVSVLFYRFNLFHLLVIFVMSVEMVALFSLAKNLQTHLVLGCRTPNRLFDGIRFFKRNIGIYLFNLWD